MKNIHRALLSLTIVSAIPFSSFGMVKLVSLEKKDAKKIIIIGTPDEPLLDLEKSARERKTNREVVQAFLAMLGKKSRNAAVILPMTESQLDAIEKKGPQGDPFDNLGVFVAKRARENNGIYENVACYFPVITAGKAEYVSDLISAAFQNQLTDLKNRLAGFSRERGNPTFAQLFASVDEQVAKARELQRQGDVFTAVYVEGLIKDVLQAKQQGMRLFKDHSQNYFFKMAEIFENNGTMSHDAINEYTSWLTVLPGKFMEIGLVLQLAQSLAKHDVVIFLNGAGATQVIKNYSNYLLYKTDLSEGRFHPQQCSCEKCHGPARVFVGIPEQKAISSVQLATFLAKISIELNLDAAPTQTNAVSKALCAICQKEGATKLCSRCKAKVYCSIDCQTKDWPSHKLVCKSPAQ